MTVSGETLTAPQMATLFQLAEHPYAWGHYPIGSKFKTNSGFVLLRLGLAEYDSSGGPRWRITDAGLALARQSSLPEKGA